MDALGAVGRSGRRAGDRPADAPAHAASLDERERDHLYAAVREVLGGAFTARRGVPIDRLKAHKVASMQVHGRTGQACPICGATVADVPGSKGAAQYCPVCQPE